jgi:hypothetical protein
MNRFSHAIQKREGRQEQWGNCNWQVSTFNAARTDSKASSAWKEK